MKAIFQTQAVKNSLDSWSLSWIDIPTILNDISDGMWDVRRKIKYWIFEWCLSNSKHPDIRLSCVFNIHLSSYHPMLYFWRH